jgi:Flp pilus assembly protein TadG
MMVGIFEFARAYQIQQVVVNAAREGARRVVLPPNSAQGVENDSAEAVAVVQNYLVSGNISGESISITGDETTTGSAVTVAVTVPYSFTLVGPLIRLVTGANGGPGDINLSSQATMRVE